MRLRTGLLICCCLGLAACTAGAPKGPDVTVSTPSVGRPAPPSSVQAALSRMAFTPYAALGQSNNDGLAPNESSYALAQACLNAAGYPGAGNVPFAVSLGPANLSFAQPWGAWGYLGTAAAQQYGFRAPVGSALSTLGIDANPAAADPADLPQAEQAAIGKCSTISQEFTDAIGQGPLAGILTLSNDIASDVRKDAAVKTATQQWAACMARNGYSYQQPQNVFFDQIKKMFGGRRQINPGDTGAPPPTRRRSRRPSPMPTAPSPPTWPGSTSLSRPATSSRSSAPTPKRSTPRSSSTRRPTPRSSRSSRPC